jgi:hypothetical protein
MDIEKEKVSNKSLLGLDLEENFRTPIKRSNRDGEELTFTDNCNAYIQKKNGASIRRSQETLYIM